MRRTNILHDVRMPAQQWLTNCLTTASGGLEPEKGGKMGKPRACVRGFMGPGGRPVPPHLPANPRDQVAV